MSTANSGSDNNNNSSSAAAAAAANKTRAYTPPLWLTGEKQPHRAVKFSVPIPPAPAGIRAAVAKAVRVVPFSEERMNLSNLKSKLADDRDRVRAVEAEIAKLERKKERGLRDIREKRREETAAALKALEKEMTAKHEKEVREYELGWKKEIEEECNRKRKAQNQEREAKLKEEEQKEEEAKRRKLESIAAAAERQHEPSERLRALRTDLETQKKALDALQEKRTEIVWLLKQVIKAEEKQKSKMEKKPEAKTLASKQA